MATVSNVADFNTRAVAFLLLCLLYITVHCTYGILLLPRECKTCPTPLADHSWDDSGLMYPLGQ